MAEFLFEIFCEEIPARMQVRAGKDLSKALTDGLKKAGLSVDDVQVFTGPRRLTYAAELPLSSPDVSEERKGPRVGAPEQALGGFMKAAGLSDISEAQIKSDKKGDFYVAITESKGRDTADILSELIPSIMGNFPWPKSMKSGATNFRWVRPLQSLICLLDGKVVDFEVGGVTSGNVTEGHRRHGKGPFEINSLNDYVTALQGEGHVILAHDARKDLIAEHARKACADKGLELIEDEGLLNEVAGLAEWPVVILGDMDLAFLDLPAEVIRLSMRTHQKYFAVRDPKTGKLAPNFIVVANQAAPDGGVEIAKGNAKVLSARLSDAVFFQSEDRKKKLEDYYDKLDTVVFHKKLGSIKDKAERVAALARELAPKVGADPNKAEAAARLAKCDLVTQTVVEFTSLQGQIGRLMYEAATKALSPALSRGPSSEDDQSDEGAGDGSRVKPGNDWGESDHADIAIAIEDHYKPQGPSDDVPTNPVAIAVALADKLDTLVGFWAIDEKPTGSKDPFALRRAALGIVRVVLENDVRINWRYFILLSLHVLASQEPNDSKLQGFVEDLGGVAGVLKLIDLSKVPETGDALVDSHEISIEVMRNLSSFLQDRLKVHLRDDGIRHDIIDAALAKDTDDLVAIVNRVTALQDFIATEDGENLLAGYKRASNILKSAEFDAGAPDKGTQAEETALFTALTTARPKIEAALASEDYAGAMTAFAALRGPIDAFLDNVMVNSDKPAERENRLRLLKQIRDTARTIADFEAIQG